MYNLKLVEYGYKRRIYHACSNCGWATLMTNKANLKYHNDRFHFKGKNIHDTGRVASINLVGICPSCRAVLNQEEHYRGCDYRGVG